MTTLALSSQIDLGNLYYYNSQSLLSSELKSNSDDRLLNLARDNAQKLITELLKLETERKEDVIVLKLPEPQILLPREKHVPKPRPPTKWESFAKTKGILNKKKERMVYDEITKSWKPSWGYDRANNDKTKNWLIELPDNGNAFEDAFATKYDLKQQNKHKIQRAQQKNLLHRQHINAFPQNSLQDPNKSFGSSNKEKILKSIHETRKATASLGTFTPKLPHENIQALNKGLGVKRKFESLYIDPKREKASQLTILSQLESKQPKLQVEKLSNMKINTVDREAFRDKKRTRSQMKDKNKMRKFKTRDQVQSRKGITDKSKRVKKGR